MNTPYQHFYQIIKAILYDEIAWLRIILCRNATLTAAAIHIIRRLSYTLYHERGTHRTTAAVPLPKFYNHSKNTS